MVSWWGGCLLWGQGSSVSGDDGIHGAPYAPWGRPGCGTGEGRGWPFLRLGELRSGAAAGRGHRKGWGRRRAAVDPGLFQGLGSAAGGGADTDPLTINAPAAGLGEKGSEEPARQFTGARQTP